MFFYFLKLFFFKLLKMSSGLSKGQRISAASVTTCLLSRVLFTGTQHYAAVYKASAM